MPLVLRLLVLVLLALAATPSRARSQSAAAAVVAAFAPFDHDGDGRPEVRRLEVLAERVAEGRPLVLVLVEARLVPAEAAARRESPLLRALATHADDLANEGFASLCVAAEVHTGPPHQDGRTVLALRALLQRLQAAGPLAGAVLVGHFPDALLVRTCNWRRNEVIRLPGKEGKPVAFDASTTNVRCVPEIVAHRCDVVLADLDGAWEAVYVPGPAKLPSVTAVFGPTVPDEGGPAVAMRVAELAVIDVFHVRDGAAVVDAQAFSLRLDANDRDHECGAADKARSNAMAVPDVSISRIDARGVALLPDAVPGALDAAGRPIAFAADRARSPWRHDAAFELQLLCEHFARNHAFRTTPLAAEADRPAAFGHGLGSGFGSLLAAREGWAKGADRSLEVQDRGDLTALVRWFQSPAVLRTLRVHSDPWCGVVAATDPRALEQTLGAPFCWRKDGERFVPSWIDHRGGRADFAFYRTMWQRQLAGESRYLMVHTGCEALSPPGSVGLAHDDEAYGRFGHAESLLFFTPCVAMVGRAKVFYDEPRGFAEALGAGASMGEALCRYFEAESAAANFDEVGGDIGRKRAYFWSLVGDFTLRLPKR